MGGKERGRISEGSRAEGGTQRGGVNSTRASARTATAIAGGGGIGNTLNSLTFLALASDDFLATTIIHGRPGTAMPSWRELSAQDVSDLLAYLRSFQQREPDRERVIELVTADEVKRIGAVTYRAWCTPCHGSNGEAGIGVNLSSDDFLARVSPEYLFDAITKGRPGTAMPAWNFLSDEQIAGLIAHLKSWQGRPDDPEPATRLPRGDWRLGEVIYESACVSCHGAQGRGGSGPQIANRTFLRSASDSQLFAWIGRGKIGTAMKGFLPLAQGVVALSEAQILDVIAYLRYQSFTAGERIVTHPTGDPVRGSELYVGSCAPCHGPDGEGASGPQLNNSIFLASASNGFLEGTIALGRTGTPMRSMVHGREGLAQISPDEIDDVVAYLRTWTRPSSWKLPRPAVDRTAQDIELGRIGFSRYCASCHGPNGRGEGDGPDYLAPALNNPEFLRSASDGFLLATIARGRRETPMRAFGRGAGGIADLPGEDIIDIVTYIRSWGFSPEGGVDRVPPRAPDAEGTERHGSNSGVDDEEAD